jgi:hypothetical protein
MGKVTVWHTPCYWSVQIESHIQTSYTYGIYQSSRGGPSQIHLWKVVPYIFKVLAHANPLSTNDCIEYPLQIT